ncbi:putative pentatricopeptide repeat-containing protein at1g68930 [Phtheirospermum japonicum]|uniref:Putative pentatricopeptide repeat-containing protein at1g68930 n=1 Tax=Phtheirospermum japonicum TaxID=374723 RepID=A0A830C7M6_9LAMI|nr:putative pentatricopeptide repeat-containing protein at1g68930 [Phtheirospermum japonicum]
MSSISNIYCSLLKQCCEAHNLKQAKQLHAHIIRTLINPETFLLNNLTNGYIKLSNIKYARRVFDEMPTPNQFSWNTILSAYSKNGDIPKMQDIFNLIPTKDGVSWNLIISGYVKRGSVEKALEAYKSMLRQGSENLNRITLSTVIIMLSNMGRVDLGQAIQGQVTKYGFGSYVFVGSPLVDMYAKCGLILEAKRVFDELPEKNLNVFVASALLDMYSKCRDIKNAEIVFRLMRIKNIVSWTAMVVAYGQHGFCEEAVRVFCEMQRNGIGPDEFTLGSVISSCANLASLEEGAQFHGRAHVSGLISFITVSNALVTLYAKCGNILESHCLFDEIKFKDEVTWTALVSGYAKFGKANETIGLFEEMLGYGLKPDEVTFVGVLSACSRAGFVDKGRLYFDLMVDKFGIRPVLDHYTCMIDLYSRSGNLEEAKKFILEMPFRPDTIGWATLLSSCRNFGNMEIGKWAAESLLELDPQNPAGHVLLVSIYAAKGKWDEVARLRRGMRDKGVRKEPGCSWIKYKNKVHIFTADDKSNPFSDRIYEELEKMNCRMIEEGYVPDVKSVLHDVEESEKLKMLSHHSERLAIAFGLIFVPSGLQIKVVKNLRVCDDCHNATKFMSKVTGREILVRDAARFHLFKDGKCSCGDFW